jgi:predicted amidophosphoribosyltransferase
MNLNDSILSTANDNGKVPACEACGAPAASKDRLLCAVCTADINDHIDEQRFHFGDPEGECFDAGLNTDPRY